MDLPAKIRSLICPVLERFELSVPDMVAICRYRLGKPEIDRQDVILALRNAGVLFRARYAPYYDLYRPASNIRISRREYVNSLPQIIRRLIVFELQRYVRDEKYWKRRHVYQQLIDEVEVKWM